VDRALVAIARWAEQGGEAPFLQLLAGNFLVLGQPVSQLKFAEVWEQAAADAQVKQARPRRSDRDAVRQEITAQVHSILEPVRQSIPGSASDPDSLCFAPGRAVFMSTGEGADVPCLRVPLDQVVAWWGGAVNWKQGGGGGGWFVGGVFPVDN
jgi:hypothetical protein